MTSPAEFMNAAPAAMSGSSPWAARYAAELRQVVTNHSRHSARNTQRHLGPSELGSPCDRQVVGKMAGQPTTNHVADPWPSIVGTAVHAWLAEAFRAANNGHGLRWIAEQRVIPHPNHPGTADLYDAIEQCVVDHKNLGKTTLSKLRRHGPPQKYKIQLLLYGLGYRQLGLPVQRVVIAAYPRTGSSLDDLYVWEAPYDTEAELLLTKVFERTAQRAILAQAITDNTLTLNHIPATPDDDECYFCPFYRPQSAHDDGPGCPGTITKDQP